MDRWEWTQAEKKIARRVFDAAVAKELSDTISDFKGRAQAVASPVDMWELEPYLAKRRRAIDQKYDYRYSRLMWVFSQLVAEGRVQMEDLEGLAAAKLEEIQRVIDAWRE